MVANEVWLFGGVERGNHQRCFVVPVERRNAATLLPLIEEHIEPGSIIHSDMWRAYGGIPNLPHGYHQHFTVNHQQNFINPNTGAHTQSVESMWQKVKARAKRQFGDSRSLFETYLPEYLWRQRFGDYSEIFFHFWSQISLIYPCER